MAMLKTCSNTTVMEVLLSRVAGCSSLALAAQCAEFLIDAILAACWGEAMPEKLSRRLYKILPVATLATLKIH